MGSFFILFDMYNNLFIGSPYFGTSNVDCGSFQVKEVAPEARRRDASLSFAFVYPSKTGRFVLKEVTYFFSLSDCMMFLCI